MSADKAAKSKPAHPPFADMIAEGIRALGRGEHSAQAICKAIEEKHGPTLKSGIVSWQKQVGSQLKRMAAAGKLVRVKNSFKLGEELKKATKPKKPRAPKAKAAEGGEKKEKKKPAAKKEKKPKAATKEAAEKKKKATPKKKKEGGAAKGKAKAAAAPKAKKAATKKKASPAKKAAKAAKK